MRRLALGVSLLTIAVVFGLRMVHHATRPPFRIGATLRRRPRLEIEELTIERRVGRGTLRIEARTGTPDQHHLGHIALGPSSHMSLRGVRLRYQAPDGEGWTARGRKGRLEGHRFEITDGAVLVAPDGRERHCRRVSIRFRTGAVSVK